MNGDVLPMVSTMPVNMMARVQRLFSSDDRRVLGYDIDYFGSGVETRRKHGLRSRYPTVSTLNDRGKRLR
jgi:hypothetical protein